MKISMFSPIRFLALHLYLGWWSIFNFCQVEVKILFMPMDIQSLCHHLLKTFFLLWNTFAVLSKISLVYLKVKVLVAQLCLTLCDPMDSSPPGSSDPGILQARILEWVAISFSNAWKWKVKVKSLSRAWLLATPWTAAHQVPPSMGFSRQEY